MRLLQSSRLYGDRAPSLQRKHRMEFIARIPSMRRPPQWVYSAVMTTSNFRVVPLQTQIAEAARAAAEAGAADHAVVITDVPQAYPCRHCLKWAKLGERMVLFPFASVPAGHPYSESGPIFVHADRCERYRAI